MNIFLSVLKLNIYKTIINKEQQRLADIDRNTIRTREMCC